MSGMPTSSHLPTTLERITPSHYHHPSMSGRPDPVNKIGVMADVVGEVYHTYTHAKATQLIYCETVMVYAEIKRDLMQRGIPAAEIAFIQDYDSKTKKAALFAAVNTGSIRVLLASKQSTGMNIQQRLIALHHLDCPWRPGDLEQREGRIVRQGNVFPEVMIFAYVTEGSFDGYRWQTVETKASFIEQMKRGDVSMREMDDLGDTVLSAAEIKALASGNPLIMIKVKLDMEVQKLETEAAGDRDNRVRMRKSLLANAHERERIQQRIPFLEAAHTHAQTHTAKEFKAAVLNGVLSAEATAYTKREAAGEAVLKVLGELDALAQTKRERQTMLIGEYQGFELRGNGYVAGMPDLVLVFAYQGERRALTATTMSLKTATGVFQSIDHHIRDIGNEINRAHARIAELDQEDSKIAALLEIPWAKAEALTEKRARLDTINAELMVIDPQPAPAAPTAPTEPGDAAPAQVALADTLVIVAESDVEHLSTPSAWVPYEMDRPVVVLPTPDHPEAMQAAIRALSGVVEAEAPPPETTKAAPVAEVADGVAVAETEADAPAEEPLMLELAPPTLDIPRKREPALVFGSSVFIPRKVVKQAAPTSMPSAQADLFSMPELAQATLW